MKATYIFGAAILAVTLIVGIVFAVNSANNTDEANQQTSHDHDYDSSSYQSPNKNSSNTELKSYTLDQVKEHDKEDDCWMVIDNGVYDVTEYVSQHPGGDDILRGCGEDATELFETRKGTAQEGAPHSSTAYNVLADYQIGKLVTE